MFLPRVVDPESSTQADGAQSSRVPVLLPEDPYERWQLCLEQHFHKRFRSSYESSPSVSPPDLPSRKRYRGMFELVEDSEEDEEIDKSLDSDSVGKEPQRTGVKRGVYPEMRILLRVGTMGLACGGRGPGMDDESLWFDLESMVRMMKGRGLRTIVLICRERWSWFRRGGGGYTWGSAVGSSSCGDSCERAFRTWVLGVEAPGVNIRPTLTTWTYPKDGMVYIDVPTYPPPAPPVQTPPSPE
ncbi:hypothetical protein Tco_0059487 [Tanacetum coccineum]